jgi:hypothetical protein
VHFVHAAVEHTRQAYTDKLKDGFHRVVKKLFWFADPQSVEAKMQTANR